MGVPYLGMSPSPVRCRSNLKPIKHKALGNGCLPLVVTVAVGMGMPIHRVNWYLSNPRFWCLYIRAVGEASVHLSFLIFFRQPASTSISKCYRFKGPVIIIVIIIWCFILCERQFFYKNSLALSTKQNKSHNIIIYILH